MTLDSQIQTYINDLVHLYHHGRISFKSLIKERTFFFSENVKMIVGIAGFIENKPIVIIATEADFDFAYSEIRKELNRNIPFVVKMTSYLMDVFL